MKVFSIDGIIPVVDATAFVHPSAVLIGDVIIGPRCYVGPNASLRGDFGRVVMQAGSNLQDTCVMHAFPGMDVVIEMDGHVGHGAVLHGCTVGCNALIGMNAVIMDGAIIGESSIVAACAFVKGRFECPARSLVMGCPATIKRRLRADEVIWKKRATVEYQELAIRSLKTMRAVEALEAAEVDRKRIKIRGLKPKK